MPESSAEAGPWRNCGVGEKAHTRRGSDENRTVSFGNLVYSRVDVFIRIENGRRFNRKIGPIGTVQNSGVIYFEGVSSAKGKSRIRDAGIQYILIADERNSEASGNLVIAVRIRDLCG